MPRALTDEQIKQEESFMKGVPRFNIGAFFLPPIWGPAHGLWITILYYPAWLLADNLFYAAYSDPSAMSIVLAVTVMVVLLAVTILFAILAQPYAWHRAHDKGKTKEQYLAAERKWAVVSVIVGIALIALATIYNTQFRTEI